MSKPVTIEMWAARDLNRRLLELFWEQPFFNGHMWMPKQGDGYCGRIEERPYNTEFQSIEPGQCARISVTIVEVLDTYGRPLPTTEAK